ncbi:type II toxin-antitoxin system HicA family toxin [Rhizobium sophoriradicis]|nr:type II toxin-antitoxin system HicA family toxin [Rhizobium sophoriradicis]
MSGQRARQDGIIASFHRPHPDKEAKRYLVRDAREFLMQIGVTP